MRFSSFVRKVLAMDESNNTKNDRIISVSACKKILNRNGNFYSDNQIIAIRDFLIVLAELQYSDYKSKRDETGNSIYKGVNGRAG